MTDQLIFPERGRGADKLKINFMTEGQLVVVRTFGSGPEADMAKDALEAAGIDAMIQADTPVACGPTLPGPAAGLNC